MGKVSRLHMYFNESLVWNSERASNTDLRCINNNLRLMEHWLLHNNLRLLEHWLLDNNLRHRNFWSLDDYLGHLHLRCLNDDLRATMPVMEFRLEVNSPCWVSVELYLNPLFPWTMLRKNRQWYVGLSNEWRRQWISVANSDVHLVREHVCFDLHELERPVWILASVLANCRSPLLLTDFDDYERVHFVKGTAEVALKMR